MKTVYFAQINNKIAEATFLPIASAYIWEYCRTQVDIASQWQLGNVFFERQTIDEYFSKIRNPDVFAFSTYVWNWDITQQLATEVKKRYPNCLVVFGGPQVPYNAEWLVNNKHMCDLVVTYAGEKPFLEILRGNYEYPGIISDSHYKIPNPDKEINYIPSPYLSGFMDTLIEPGKKYSTIIETNRGCPYACTFCDQEALYYNKIQLFDADRVLKEIDWVAEHKIDFLHVSDSNLGIFDRDISFVKYIAKKRNETGYPKHIDYNTAKQQPSRIVEIGKILNKEAGIKRGVTIALQSMNKETLKAIKRTNIVNEKLEQVINEYNSAGIENYCELIIGLPEESFTSWINGIGKILEIGSDHALLVHPLSIVPNTPFSDPAYIEKYKLKYTPTPAPAGGNTYPEDSLGEVDFVCYETSKMTADEWVDAYFFAKGIVIPHHYHGVSQVIATYLNRIHSIPLIEFYTLLFNISKFGQGFLNSEYTAHTTSVKQSLFDMKTWGRPINDSDNFHFQDNGATASKLYSSIAEVHAEIIDAVKNTYNIDITEVAEFNEHVLDIHSKSVHTRTFSKNWNEWFFNNVSLVSCSTTVSVERKEYADIIDHAKHIFWYGRKSKRCFLKVI